MDMSKIFAQLAPPTTPQAPDWLRSAGVCPVLRNGQMWWKSGNIFAIGFPPEGTPLRHADFHHVPDDFGPSGEPKQVETGPVDIHGVMAMNDQLGERVAYIFKRDYDVLVDLARSFGSQAVRTFAYPDIAEGEPQYLALFIPATRHKQGTGNLFDAPEIEETNELIGFIWPTSHNPSHYLTIEEMERLPRFGGTILGGEHDD
jgi:hypothetical protein